MIQRWTWLAFCRKSFLGYNSSRIDLKEGMTMQEKKAFHVNGYLGLIVAIAVAVLGVWLGYRSYAGQQHGELAVGVVLILLAALCASALTIVQPNEAKVLTFFGNYIGTIRDAGLFMTVPLTDKQSISLRVRNFNSQG